MDKELTSGSFTKAIDRLLRPTPQPGDPLMPKCDCCPQEATTFYKSQPRNKLEHIEYHAFCTDHDSPFDESAMTALGTTRISLEQYVCEYIHES